MSCRKLGRERRPPLRFQLSDHQCRLLRRLETLPTELSPLSFLLSTTTVGSPSSPPSAALPHLGVAHYGQKKLLRDQFNLSPLRGGIPTFGNSPIDSRIVHRPFEKKGFKLKGLKLFECPKELAEIVDYLGNSPDAGSPVECLSTRSSYGFRAMMELNQILMANEINFAILAALPAFFLSLEVLMLLYARVKQDSRAKGRGKIAGVQRRLLIVKVEKKIVQFQNCIDQGAGTEEVVQFITKSSYQDDLFEILVEVLRGIFCGTSSAAKSSEVEESRSCEALEEEELGVRDC
ncbi:hypothetical protein L2E82_02838 [Cichorium intybus]|uniref:Uncharacterized protein n=1 Tax=Cichorium intybus TaxID=13427 RepID=A0ACB9H3D6_CICIN|nr:hypothetical protein L2E82_02838 [Cichorium intybus]